MYYADRLYLDRRGADLVATTRAGAPEIRRTASRRMSTHQNLDVFSYQRVAEGRNGDRAVRAVDIYHLAP